MRNIKIPSCFVFSVKLSKIHAFFMDIWTKKGKMRRKDNRLNLRGTESYPEIKIVVGWHKKGIWVNQHFKSRLKKTKKPNFMHWRVLSVQNGSMNEVEDTPDVFIQHAERGKRWRWSES